MEFETEETNCEETPSQLSPSNVPTSLENEEDILPSTTHEPQSPKVTQRKVQKKKLKGKERGDPALYPSSVAVVREVYDGDNAYEFFERELEWALEACAPAIVIEPSRLGDETARWIAVGNCLHKGGVIVGAACIVAGTLWPNYPVLYIPPGVCSLLCTSLYTFSWSPDPCCKYQVETDPKALANILPLHLLSSSGWITKSEGLPSSSSSSSSSSSHRYPLSSSPVVLVRKDDSRRKILHSTVTLCAVLVCTYQLYSMRK
ncbi:hypothetical protein J437_LFUL007141 [Ladona fulva]|uniref:Transmembrane protein 11 n=1 Tax=Ladona fulva TaxID=123851 RepID=A0A8K0KBE5_LADFU|nr:hypothetical protein J437_LFUL007141 [Ladona fulva]